MNPLSQQSGLRDPFAPGFRGEFLQVGFCQSGVEGFHMLYRCITGHAGQAPRAKTVRFMIPRESPAKGRRSPPGQAGGQPGLPAKELARAEAAGWWTAEGARFAKDFPAYAGNSSRPSSGNGESNGQIVGKSNGEGCGAPYRVESQNQNETANCSR